MAVLEGTSTAEADRAFARFVQQGHDPAVVSTLLPALTGADPMKALAAERWLNANNPGIGSLSDEDNAERAALRSHAQAEANRLGVRAPVEWHRRFNPTAAQTEDALHERDVMRGRNIQTGFVSDRVEPEPVTVRTSRPINEKSFSRTPGGYVDLSRPLTNEEAEALAEDYAESRDLARLPAGADVELAYAVEHDLDFGTNYGTTFAARPGDSGTIYAADLRHDDSALSDHEDFMRSLADDLAEEYEAAYDPERPLSEYTEEHVDAMSDDELDAFLAEFVPEWQPEV